MKRVMFSSAFLLLLSLGVEARVLNVPADQQTISAAIEASEGGDTVLVSCGTYNEAINFGGKAITVAGNFLLTANPLDIDSTIISAAGITASVVRFDHNEDSTSQLIGFTLRDGSGSGDEGGDACGGGVHISSCSPTLSHLVVTECSALVAGGIMIQRGSPVISDVTISRTYSERFCGGVYLSRSGTYARLIRVVIDQVYGPEGNPRNGLGCYNGASGTLTNCTIWAEGDYSAIWVHEQTHLKAMNCVLRGASPIVFYLGGFYDSVSVSYSWISSQLIQDDLGPACQLEDRGGNITEDPLLIEPDSGDFTPTWANFPEEDSTKSPLIDAGDPDLPNDEDGSRCDIGAISFVRGGFVTGRVLRTLDETPIEGAIVTGPRRTCDTTDAEGNYFLRNIQAGLFSMQVRATGFDSSEVADLEVSRLDTIFRDIHLTGPVLRIESDSLRLSLGEGDSSSLGFQIANTGNSDLKYSMATRPAGEFGIEPGTVRLSVPLSEVMRETKIFGPIFVHGQYFVPAANRVGRKQIYVLNKEGGLIRSFDQPPTTQGYGIQSLTWDGEKFWGTAATDTLFAFSEEEGIFEQVVLPSCPSISSIAWDFGESTMWYCNYTSDIYRYDIASRSIVDTVSRSGLRIYGLGYYPDDADHYPLYIISSLAGRADVRLFKMNPTTGDTMLVHRFRPTQSVGYGAFVEPHFDRYGNAAAISFLIDTIQARSLEVVQLTQNSRWASVTPNEGVILPGNSADFTLTLNATDLIPEVYPGEIRINHNAPNRQTAIPFLLTVRPLSAADDSPTEPAAFKLNSCYPSPFNSATVISFTLDQTALSGGIRLAVYDVAGRLVEELTPPGRLERGEQRVVWDAEGAAAGVYLVRLEGGGMSVVKKAVLMR